MDLLLAHFTENLLAVDAEANAFTVVTAITMLSIVRKGIVVIIIETVALGIWFVLIHHVGFVVVFVVVRSI